MRKIGAKEKRWVLRRFRSRGVFSPLLERYIQFQFFIFFFKKMCSCRFLIRGRGGFFMVDNWVE